MRLPRPCLFVVNPRGAALLRGTVALGSTDTTRGAACLALSSDRGSGSGPCTD